MSRQLKMAAALALAALLATAGCTPYHLQGAGIGSYAGSLAGAVLDQRNPWRGGAIGAMLGAIAGATIADISLQGAREAATYDRPVVYRTEGAPEGYGGYIAEPVEPGARARCKKVRERIYENERLVSDRIKEVCEGVKNEPPY